MASKPLGSSFQFNKILTSSLPCKCFDKAKSNFPPEVVSLILKKNIQPEKKNIGWGNVKNVLKYEV